MALSGMQSSSKQPRAAEPDTKRLRSVNLGLTWPRAAFDNTYLLNVLKEKLRDKVVYILVCQESHEDGGLHSHAFVKLCTPLNSTNMRFFDVDGHHAHIETVRNVKSWIAYVKKERNWVEFGVSPLTVEKMSKKERNERILRDGIAKCVEDGVIDLMNVQRYIAGVEALRIMNQKQREVPVVYWFYGSTGTGKTRKAVQIGGDDYWISSNNLRWFDGYRGQKVAIIDDIRSNSCPFNFLLRLLDRNVLNVEIKGGYTAWTPQKIIITCPVHWERLFVNHETGETWDNIDQLKRRIHIVRNFDEEPWGPADEQEPVEAPTQQESLSSIRLPPPPPAELHPLEPELNLDLRMGPMEDLPEVSCGFHPVLDTWWDGEKYVKPVEHDK